MGATQNWVDSEDLAMMYRATFVPDFYRALHAVVHARFRAPAAPSIGCGAGHAARSWAGGRFGI